MKKIALFAATSSFALALAACGGADHVVMAERETAARMAERAMLTRAS